MGHYRWNILPPVPSEFLQSTDGFSPLIARLLYHRGIREPSQFEPFIKIDRSLLNDPFLLPDIHKATGRIYQALLSGEKIAIYGDFDTDGVTSTAVLVEGLSALGCQTLPYIPHRLKEGYGLNKTAIKELHQQGVSLIITTDCGITALAEVETANHLGVDIIITDHHTPLPELPSALAVINPKLPTSGYPFSELAGVGVAFKLVQALLQGVSQERKLNQLLDLVALGTVADMVPLLGENRYLVKQGLSVINTSPRLGIREMARRSGLKVGQIGTENVSWVLAPRLNAAGRMEHAIHGYELLVTSSPQEACEIAIWLETKNTERQSLTTKAVTRARQQVLSQGVSPLLLVCDDEVPAGVCGLVASRLLEEFYRPAIVVKTGEKLSTGSCRSIGEFNIISALRECQHLFTRFGGHAQAAGFSIPTESISCLRDTLLKSAGAQLAEVDLRPRLDIDAEVDLIEMAGDTYTTIGKMAPFGNGNPVPVFLSRQVEVVNCRSMGAGGEHLRFKLRQGKVVWDGVAFGLGCYLPEVSRYMDIVFNLEVDSWRGLEKLRLNILDFAPAGSINDYSFPCS